MSSESMYSKNKFNVMKIHKDDKLEIYYVHSNNVFNDVKSQIHTKHWTQIFNHIFISNYFPMLDWDQYTEEELIALYFGVSKFVYMKLMKTYKNSQKFKYKLSNEVKNRRLLKINKTKTLHDLYNKIPSKAANQHNIACETFDHKSLETNSLKSTKTHNRNITQLKIPITLAKTTKVGNDFIDNTKNKGKIRGQLIQFTRRESKQNLIKQKVSPGFDKERNMKDNYPLKSFRENIVKKAPFKINLKNVPHKPKLSISNHELKNEIKNQSIKLNKTQTFGKKKDSTKRLKLKNRTESLVNPKLIVNNTLKNDCVDKNLLINNHKTNMIKKSYSTNNNVFSNIVIKDFNTNNELKMSCIKGKSIFKKPALSLKPTDDHNKKKTIIENGKLHEHAPSCGMLKLSSFNLKSSINKNTDTKPFGKVLADKYSSLLKDQFDLSDSKTILRSTKKIEFHNIKLSENVPTMMPLTENNLLMLAKIKESEVVSKYIKEYKAKYDKIPQTRIEFYRIGRLLGKGAFGKVNLGMHKLTGKLVAIKSIKKIYLNDESSKKKVMQEFSILKELRHPNVIRLYESFETEKHILIVTELCSGGDLLNYITKRKKLSEDMAKFAFKSIISGLEYCHTHRVLHRDIKLDNVLMNSDSELKICDFGVSKIISKGEILNDKCGTPAYMAPEILKGKGYKGFTVDLWSAGVALYAMLYGTVPFKSTNIKELRKFILKSKLVLKEDISADARDLLSKLLTRNPSERLGIYEVISHKWMQNVAVTSLFTAEEKDIIKKDCWKNSKQESEEITLFTEQGIESTRNELIKNDMTKSVILAPFNTTQSHTNIEDLPMSGCDLIDKRLIINFSDNIRDIDRQFEKNNNSNIDNGVYTKFVYKSQKDDNENDISEYVESKDNSYLNVESDNSSLNIEEYISIITPQIGNLLILK